MERYPSKQVLPFLFEIHADTVRLNLTFILCNGSEVLFNYVSDI